MIYFCNMSGVETGNGISDKERYWRQVENVEANPALILAKILMERSLEVSISGALDVFGHPIPDHVDIFVSKDAGRFLKLSSQAPEFMALNIAFNPRLLRRGPEVENCQWDQSTKYKVYNTYYKNLLEGSGLQVYVDHLKLSYSVQRNKKGIKEVDRMMEEWRGKIDESELLTPPEIRSLLEQVVDRVLAQAQS